MARIYRYHKWKADRPIPYDQWVTLGQLRAPRFGLTTPQVQMLITFDDGDRPYEAKLKFVRVYNDGRTDGTGDTTLAVPQQFDTWQVQHKHTIKSRRRMSIAAQVYVLSPPAQITDRPAVMTARYRILKVIRS